jgi:Xaa-Pro aminopeptidase
MTAFEINLDLCRGRQRRLLDEMQRQKLDLVIVTRIEHVQWLTGVRFGWVFSPAAALSADGHLTLCAPNRPPEKAAADTVCTYEAQWNSTLRNDQPQAAAEALSRALAERQRPRRIGVEFSTFGRHYNIEAETLDIEPTLFRLRRRKDADELALLGRAIAATGAMYAEARRIIEPGMNELEMFNRLQATAVESCGEMLTGTGNDYASGVRGGPPRDRRIEDGELYILDLGPACRGYFADNCRALAVNRRPTDLQQAACQHIAAAFTLVEQFVRPGARCRQLVRLVQEHMDRAACGTFDHHLGHGIGLFPHEAPHLNLNWDDTFEEGDVFTSEPGLYAPDLRAGIRLENDYRVTATGVELLSDFPLGL